MNPNIRPATAADVPALAARFTRVHAWPADSRPDSFRARARQIAALGADPEKIFRVWTDESGPGPRPAPEPLDRRPLKTLREERWA